MVMAIKSNMTQLSNELSSLGSWKFCFVSLVWLSCICLAPVWHCQAAQPGELFELKVSPEGEQDTTIRLRYCPSGTLQSGIPTVASANPEVAPQLQIRHFYISETEITIGQLRKVLTDSALTPMKESAKLMTARPELINVIENGEDQPACLVPLEVAVDFCLKLQELFDKDRLTVSPQTIESRLFRLPSHIEWQYAARGVHRAEDIPTRPHFARWVEFSDLTPASQQKCQELWENLGKSGRFPGDQHSFIAISGVTGGEQQEKLKDILSEAFTKGMGAAKRASSGIGELQPVRSTLPNNWSISDLHDGVTEWAIFSGSQQRAVQLWERFRSARQKRNSLDADAEFFLCGGSFVDSYFGTNALKRFTIWGGPTLSGDHADPITASAELVFDKAPGFRLLMERTVADDWLFVIRENVFQSGKFKPNAVDFVAASQENLKEIAIVNHPSERVLQFYLQLALSSGNARQELAAEVQKFVSHDKPAESPAEVSDLTAKLRQRLGERSGSGTTDAIPKDDSEYFQSLASLLSNSAK